MDKLGQTFFLRSAVAAGAILLVLRVERLLAVVALAAEITLRDLGHIYLVRALRHLEDLIMATGALQTFILHMLFMAEDHRRGILGREGEALSYLA